MYKCLYITLFLEIKRIKLHCRRLRAVTLVFSPQIDSENLMETRRQTLNPLQISLFIVGWFFFYEEKPFSNLLIYVHCTSFLPFFNLIRAMCELQNQIAAKIHILIKIRLKNLSNFLFCISLNKYTPLKLILRLNLITYPRIHFHKTKIKEVRCRGPLKTRKQQQNNSFTD